MPAVAKPATLIARYLDRGSKQSFALATNESGSVAILFGFAILVVCGMTALAVDYSRALAVRSKLQSAVDAAVLAADPYGNLTLSQAQANVNSVFSYNIPSNFMISNNVVATPVQITNGYQVTAVATVPTTFGKILGVNNIPVGVVAQATRGQTNLEIALVLDNTYSMVGQKITDLQSAASSLVDQIETNSTPGTVKFGLVPFSNYVNITPSRGAQWLAVQPDQTISYSYQTTSPQNCPSYTTVTYSCPTDGVPQTCSYQQCTVTVPPYTVTGSYTTTWQGCAGSRTPAPDELVGASFSSPIPGLTAVNNNPISCPSTPVQRLTTDATAIKSQINAMTVQGETYIPAGLMWGWRVLDPNSPFADGVAYNAVPKTKKIMILMTDGYNTRQQTPGGKDHETGQTQPGPADITMNDLCTKIKAAGITLYTIDYEVNSTTAQSLLQNCATDPSHYFNAQDSTALAAAFNSIAGSLVKLALTK